MAPVHHHFELEGCAEPKIIVRFWIVSILLRRGRAAVAQAAVSRWPSLAGQARSLVVGLAQERRWRRRELLLARRAPRSPSPTSSPTAQLGAEALAALGGVALRAGRPPPSATSAGADLVVVCPGVPLRRRPSSRAARAPGVPVLGRGRARLRASSPTARRCVGITGTNGKSTTTALAGRALRRRGPTHLRRRQPGHAALRGRALGPARRRAWCELSCFQLEGIERLPAPRARRSSTSPRTTSTATPAHRGLRARPRRASSRTSSRATSRWSTPTTRGAWRWPARRAGAGATASRFGRAAPERLRGPRGGGERRLLRSPSARRERYRSRNRALRGAPQPARTPWPRRCCARLAGRARPRRCSAGSTRFPGLPHRLELVARARTAWSGSTTPRPPTSTRRWSRSRPSPGRRLADRRRARARARRTRRWSRPSRGGCKGVLTIGEDAPAIEQAFAARLRRARLRRRWTRAVGSAPRAGRGRATWCCSRRPAPRYDQFKNFEDRGEPSARWWRRC